MKKVYTILSCLLLALLLFVGLWSLLDRDATYSAWEKRELETRPKVTVTGLLDGSYSAEFQSYYADTFPGREGLMASNRSLNGFYYFSGLASENSAQLAIGLNGGAADHGASLEQPNASQASTDSSDATDVTEPSETQPTEPSNDPNTTDQYGEQDPDVDAEQVGAVLLVGNRAMEVPYGSYDTIARYADAVTGIADALGSEIRVFNIAVPNAAEFYTDEDYHSGSSSQIDMIDYCYDHLGSNVTSVDAYSKLAAHTDEYLYFRTDHHWTQLGAYYAYTAFCEAAGLSAEPLSKFETDEYENFVGSMYTYISDYPQSSILKEQPDTVHIWRPFVDLNTHWYTDATLSEVYEGGTLCYVGDVDNKYLAFLGGDHPITIIETDVDNDKTVMIIKESYGNAFTPWLTSHYSKVVAVDPREFNREGKPSLDLAAFAKEQGVDDCIILNYPLMINNSSYITWLERLVK
ncbi:MAG: hypothetical protein IJ357_02740 [Oscillospiraceae bacterium]|nr:hypothetical protein [Oscillospiraceae bacterium]